MEHNTAKQIRNDIILFFAQYILEGNSFQELLCRNSSLQVHLNRNISIKRYKRHIRVTRIGYGKQFLQDFLRIKLYISHTGISSEGKRQGW